MTDGTFVAIFLVINYMLLPIGITLLAIELFITRKRASRYEKALHDIADQTASNAPSGIRSQRDMALTTARVALYDPSRANTEAARDVQG